MEFIRRHGILDSLMKTLVANDDMNLPFTLVEPVKKLTYQEPFLELRVNRPNLTGAYRAIFFTYMYKKNQILIFTNYVIKNDTSSLGFDRIVEEAQTTQARISQIESGHEGVKIGTIDKVFKALGLQSIQTNYKQNTPNF